MPSGDLKKYTKGATNFDLSDSRLSNLNVRASLKHREINRINGSMVPQLDWNKVGMGNDKLNTIHNDFYTKKMDSSRQKASTFDQSNKFRLDLSQLKKKSDRAPIAMQSREIDHEQLQSERNVLTTERGFGNEQ